MQTISVDEAQANLGAIVDKLNPGEEILLVREQRPIARLVGASPAEGTPVAGRCKGMLTILQEDDEHLKDWAEYMP